MALNDEQTERDFVDAHEHPSQFVADPNNEKVENDTSATTNGKPVESEKQQEKQEKAGDSNHKSQDDKKDGQKGDKKDDKKDEKKPSGGYDQTPIPSRPAGYTIKITMHHAENLPMADVGGFSSDPYCLAQLNTDTPTRHKEDSPLRWRTPTIRKNTEPHWNDEWIVANVPATGFKLKVRVYDEDPADHDDLLGKVHITIPKLYDGWEGIKKEQFKLLAYQGSKRAYLLQAVTTCFREDKRFHGHLFVSIEILGRTKDDGQNGRLYTVGPIRWMRHFSPMLGRLVNIKEPDKDDPEQTANQNGESQKEKEKKKAEHYNFQANQLQMQGPIPAKLYHRYVEFKPWVSRMFTKSGLTGALMGKALHHQHTRVYNFGRSTQWGWFPDGPSQEVTKQFLDLVHHDQGGRIFTYIITLDALWRFTETGKEFGIDMLSKHTMHSDVSIYIAFSGEFFIRRLKNPRKPPPPEPVEESSQSHPPQHGQNEEHPPYDVSGGPPDEDPPKDPAHYELVIDNDSGTYRPNADLLPVLKEYLSHQLPGLHILTLDCNKDADRQQAMKAEQRERKKKEGDHIIYTQGDDDDSVSSSDEEDLDALQATIDGDNQAVEREHGIFSQAAKDAKLQNKSKLEKVKRDYALKKDKHEKGEGSGPATS